MYVAALDRCGLRLVHGWGTSKSAAKQRHASPGMNEYPVFEVLKLYYPIGVFRTGAVRHKKPAGCSEK
jgi:hypothetical protein